MGDHIVIHHFCFVLAIVWCGFLLSLSLLFPEEFFFHCDSMHSFGNETVLSEASILEDALQDTKKLQAVLRTVKDYVDIYEAAGCSREVLMSRMMGKPSLRHAPRSSFQRRRASSFAQSASPRGAHDDDPLPPLFHVSVPRDPLPSVEIPVPRSTVSAHCVDLEVALQNSRVEATRDHRAEWTEYWHHAGRASDIVRDPKEHLSQIKGVHHEEVFLTLKRPDGRRTRFEALANQSSLARPVATTLKRLNPVDCHRSIHYPSPPSSTRLAKLPLPDRVPVRPVDGQPMLLAEPVSSPDVRKWQYRMGLLDA